MVRMTSSKNIDECKNCEEDFCVECSDAKDFQYCSKECEQEALNSAEEVNNG